MTTALPTDVNLAIPKAATVDAHSNIEMATHFAVSTLLIFAPYMLSNLFMSESVLLRASGTNMSSISQTVSTPNHLNQIAQLLKLFGATFCTSFRSHIVDC